MAKTADQLLTGLKRRTIVPGAQPLLSDTDMLALADDVIQNKLVPLLIGIRQDFFVTVTEMDLVDGQEAYSIPYRAIGRTLRDVKLVDTGGAVRDMSLIALEDEHLFRWETTPIGFYFRGDKIVVVPTPGQTGLSLKLWYDPKPSRLVPLDQVGIASSVMSTTVVVTAAPDTITTGTDVDFIEARSGCSILGMDAEVTNVSGTTYTFAADTIPTGFAAGDYVSVAGTSPVIQLPDECDPLIETLTSHRMLTSLGDFDGADRLEKQAADEEKSLKLLLEPRVQGESTKIISRNGLLRGNRTRFWRAVIV